MIKDFNHFYTKVYKNCIFFLIVNHFERIIAIT